MARNANLALLVATGISWVMDPCDANLATARCSHSDADGFVQRIRRAGFEPRVGKWSARETILSVRV